MKTLLAIILLAMPLAAADPTATSDKEIAAAVNAWKEAMLKGDAAALNKIYNKDLTYEHSTGKTETKAESIENATKAGGVAKAIEMHDPTTRVYGNTAIVKSVTDITNGSGAISHLDVLMVWIKTGAGWQLVARQSTKIQ